MMCFGHKMSVTYYCVWSLAFSCSLMQVSTCLNLATYRHGGQMRWKEHHLGARPGLQSWLHTSRLHFSGQVWNIKRWCTEWMGRVLPAVVLYDILTFPSVCKHTHKKSLKRWFLIILRKSAGFLQEAQPPPQQTPCKQAEAANSLWKSHGKTFPGRGALSPRGSRGQHVVCHLGGWAQKLDPYQGALWHRPMETAHQEASSSLEPGKQGQAHKPKRRSHRMTLSCRETAERQAFSVRRGGLSPSTHLPLPARRLVTGRPPPHPHSLVLRTRWPGRRLSWDCGQPGRAPGGEPSPFL